MVAFADDPWSTLSPSTPPTLFFAIKQMGAEEDASQFYGKMADHQGTRHSPRGERSSSSDFTSADLPSQTFNTASYQGKPKTW